MRWLLLATSVFGASLAASDAHAKCAAPGPKFEPESGSVPTAPVLRLFASTWASPGTPTVTAIDAKGKKLSPVITTESTADAFTSYRLAFPAAAKGKLQVHYVGANGWTRDAEYTVDPSWKAPGFVAPKVTLYRVQSSWTCSHQLTRNIQFPNVAPAYRLTFATTVAGLAKSTTTLVLPADVKTMFVAYPSTVNADLALGHVNCMGSTYSWNGGTFAKIVALFPDGSESEVSPGIWLDPP